jgi:hypothetical protein
MARRWRTVRALSIIGKNPDDDYNQNLRHKRKTYETPGALYVIVKAIADENQNHLVALGISQAGRTRSVGNCSTC